MKDYKYIGKPVIRSDAKDITTGRAMFINDLILPRMLICRVMKSGVANAIIKSIDTARAEALPGVAAIMTYKNVPENWITGLPAHRYTLDQHVRAAGDPVALVAAETKEIADEAIKLIQVEYEELPFVLTLEETVAPDAPQLYEQFEGNEFTPGCPMFSKKPYKQIKRGDIEKGFEESAYVAEGCYSYAKTPHPLPPESPGVIGTWEDDHSLVVYASAGAPHLFKMVAQEAMPGVNVEIRAMKTGGSYGNKQILTILAMYVGALSKMTHRPVKYMLDKTEHFHSWEIRLGSSIHGKVGITKDGIINAVQGEWNVDVGISSALAQGQMAVGLGEAQAMIAKCPNWDVDSKLYATNHNPGGPIRGFGGLELKSALLPLVTLAMREGNFDPVDVFSKNFASAGDRYQWRDGNWWDCASVDYREAMRVSAEKFGWKDKWKGWNIPTSVNGTKRVGVGVGVHGNADVGEDRSEAMVKLHANGEATVIACIGETGTSQRHGVQKMVAETLKLPLENVTIVDTDTRTTPFDFGMVGSRGTMCLGEAGVRAARDARRQLLEIASKKMGGIDIDALDTADGFIFVKDAPEKRMPWIAAFDGPELTIIGHGVHLNTFAKPNFVIYFVEVEVDTETGRVNILHALEGTDAGQVIDPINLKMQMEGSFGSAGADTAIFEEYVYDKNTGRLMNGNMIDYKWRTFNNFPPFDTVMLQSDFDTDSFGAIGVGEVSGAPAPSAILMAISNAIGKNVTEYPATPSVILKALEKM